MPYQKDHAAGWLADSNAAAAAGRWSQAVCCVVQPECSRGPLSFTTSSAMYPRCIAAWAAWAGTSMRSPSGGTCVQVVLRTQYVGLCAHVPHGCAPLCHLLSGCQACPGMGVLLLPESSAAVQCTANGWAWLSPLDRAPPLGYLQCSPKPWTALFICPVHGLAGAALLCTTLQCMLSAQPHMDPGLLSSTAALDQGGMPGDVMQCTLTGPSCSPDRTAWTRRLLWFLVHQAVASGCADPAGC
jgi:hypothetical protein